MSIDNNYVEGINDTIKRLSSQMNRMETEVDSVMTDLNTKTNKLSQTQLPMEGFDLAKAREQLKDLRYSDGIIDHSPGKLHDFTYPDGNSIPCGMKFNDRLHKDDTEILPATAAELMENGTYRHRQIGHDVSMFSYPWIKLIVTYAYANGIYCCICRDNTIRTIVPGNDPDSDSVVYSHIVDEYTEGYITLSPVVPEYSGNDKVRFCIKTTKSLNVLDYVGTVYVDVLITANMVSYSYGKLDKTLLIAVGYYGTILRSTDDGLSWAKKGASGVTNALHSIYYSNNTWIAVGDKGTILRSTDDGLKWTKISVSRVTANLYKICYSNNTWIIIGASGIALRSTDDGLTWTQITISGVSGNTLRGIHYVNNTWIIVGDSGTIVRSTNDGLTWSKITVDGISGIGLYDIHFSNNAWIIAGYSTILRSIDDGLTWTQIAISGVNTTLNGIYSSNNTWIAVGYYGTILRSNDDGLSWNKIECGVSETLKRIHYSNNNTWIIVGYNRTILRSTDNGLTWAKITVSDDLYGIDHRDLWPKYKPLYEKGEEIQWDTIFLKSALTNTNWPYHLVLTNKTRGVIYHVSQDMKQITEEKNVSTMIPRTDAVTHRSVAYGNGKTLICGDSGIYQLTDDGILPILYTDIVLQGIAYGNSTWIATGTRDIILRSTDNGLTWTKITVSEGSDNLRNIHYANNIWIATGYGGVLYRSTDNGLTWTKISVSGVVAWLRDIHCSNNTWITVGYDGVILRSTDNGLTWTKISVSGVSEELCGIAYGNNTWIIAGDEGAILRSTDNGLTWTKITALDTLQDIHYANNTWIAAGYGAIVYRSTDNGLTWTKITVSGIGTPVYMFLRGVSYCNNNTWAVVGDSGIIYQSIDNGVTWTKITLSGVNSTLYGIHYANNTWIAVGSSTILRSTDDGLTWSTVSLANTMLYGIYYANNTWIAVGIDGIILRSTDDGLTWAKMTVAGLTGDLNSIYYSNNTWIAVGDYATILRSTDDGLTWSAITVSGVGGTTLQGLHYSNNTWIIVGDSGTILRSTDNGLTWNQISGVTNALYSIHYGNHIWITTGTSGTILRSTDNGLTWTEITVSGVTNILFAISYSSNTWIAVGQNTTIIRSVDDGLSWNKVMSGTPNNLQGIAYGNNMWCIIGTDGALIYVNNNIIYYNTDTLNLNDIINYKLSGMIEDAVTISKLSETPHRNRFSLYNKASKLTDYIYDYGKSLNIMKGYGTAALTNYISDYTLVDKFISAVTNRYADTLGLSQIEDFTYLDGFDKVLGTYFYIGQKSQNQPSGLVTVHNVSLNINYLNYSKVVIRTVVVGSDHKIPKIKQYQPGDLPDGITKIYPRATILQIKNHNLSGLFYTFDGYDDLYGHLSSSSKIMMLAVIWDYPEIDFSEFYTEGRETTPIDPPEGLYTFYLIY